MNISLTLPQGDLDLRVDATDDATIGDLLDALRRDGLAVGAQDAVLVDGRRAPRDHGLAEVGCVDGARLRLVPAAQAASPVAGAGAPTGAAQRPGLDATRTFAPTGRGVRVAVAGGLDAGRWIDAAPGRHRIGRGADALFGHATTSERHATLDVEASGRVTVTDHGSRNGTWVDGEPVARARQLSAGALVRTGAVASRVVDLDPDDRPRVEGGDARAFNRPPRPAPPALPGPLAVPEAAPSHRAGGAPTLPIASVVGGLAMGALMWTMTGTLTYAMLAFVTPVLAVMTTLGAKRRHRRDARRAGADERRELAAFEEAVRTASQQVARRQRAVHPDLAEVVRRATAPSTRLWERRPDHDDAFHLVVGHATRRWDPPRRRGGAAPSEAAEAVLAEHAWLRDVPVVAPGGVVGVVGDRAAALAVARGLVAQACVHHGPADLEAVLLTPDPLAWDGAKWLPHLQDPATGRPRCADHAEGRGLLADLLQRRRPTADARHRPGEDDGPPATTLLVVLDGVEACEGRDAPGRAVLRGEAGPVLGVVVAPTVDRLPASCDTVVVLEGADGAARVVRPADGEVVTGVLASGLGEPTLATTARGLARFDDPEAGGGRDLPARCALPDLFGPLAPTSAEAVRQLWRRQRTDGRLRAPIGMTAGGPLVLDLAADGPHALVAGTTGAGKSELLRSLVAGLAASADPDHVAFVLVDYKGGAAFDRCADLPHVAGLVTDLDDDLAERALTCLHAELHRRERLLRDAGVGDLDAYRRLPVAAAEPLPSLVVVIDEFATLAAELPDFLDSLVGIAQRGRSLGVHLVLATQRPSGVVSDDIRANTNLRIALRVQDRQDSTDVIEDPAAATLTRDQPGRAFVRLGPGHVVAMQSALSTGPARRREGRVRVAPFVLRPGPAAADPAPAAAPVDATDLDLLVAAVREAHAAEGLRRPREPWPAPLPELLPLQELRALAADAALPASVVPVALADEPEHQRRVPAGWDLDRGSLLVVGALGSGTSQALRAIAVEAGRRHAPAPTPDDRGLHVHVLDAGRGDLAGLADLPHVGSVVRLGEDERLARLVGRLTAELDRRRAAGATDGPRIVLLVDDWEALASSHEHGPTAALHDQLVRLLVDGPSVGIVAAVAVGRPGAVGTRLLASLAQRWVLRLPDDGDGVALGARGVASQVPGRCVDVGTGRRLQLALVEDPAAEVAAVRDRWAHVDPAGLPAPVRVLPTHVVASALPAATAGAVWELPVGLRGDDLAPAVLRLHPGEGALVAGPPRSGRSTALATLAERALASGLDVVLAGPRPGPVDEVDGIRRIAPEELVVEVGRQHARPTLVLVDDADQVDAAGLDAALARAGGDVRLVAAVRADAARAAYGHWARNVGRSRVGLLLDPDVDLDGDLLGARLPRRGTAPPAVGRGWLVDGGAPVQAQVAVAEARPPARSGGVAPAAAPATGLAVGA